MQAEFEALIRNSTLVLVPPPRGRKIIGCKWVWRVKKLCSSVIDKLKSKVVGKGFHQKPGSDLSETNYQESHCLNCYNSCPV